MVEMPVFTSQWAKECNACSYEHAQCSREVDRIPRDAVYFKALFEYWTDPLISRPLRLFTASIALYTLWERGGQKLQSLARREIGSCQLSSVEAFPRLGSSCPSIHGALDPTCSYHLMILTTSHARKKTLRQRNSRV